MAVVYKGVTIEGFGEKDLASRLEHYAGRSTAAGALLVKAGNEKAKVMLTKTGGKCEAKGTEVSLSWDACVDLTRGGVNVIYLTESALFELNNAANHNKFAALDTEVKAAIISVLKYGEKMCNLEYESTCAVAEIAKQMKGKGEPVSPFGNKQITEAPRGATNFENKPHNSKGSGEDLLPSNLFYAYNYLNGLKQPGSLGMKKHIEKVAIIKKTPRNKPLDNLNFSKLRKLYNDTLPAQFLVWWIDALIKLVGPPKDNGFSITWVGVRAEWEKCANKFVEKVPTIRHDKTKRDALIQELRKC